ncbi:MAG: SPOR domain-containing protein [Sphingomonas sp.]|uniref:SPOR domain-containing protein n=1 Tax=Sphingomonas sp. TaxID=28214 RepID=UPI001B11D3FE|nr:SPOR domain-containing protein [Sphingomonas sp.]MBO9623151.1 SPOR domain-containing protein [Sphingomonas sp.]
MKWNASAVAALALLAGPGEAWSQSNLATQAQPQLVYSRPEADPTAGATGPRATSQQNGEAPRYDEVGYAGIGAGRGVTVTHRTLAPDTVVEVTSLATGRTILALVAAGEAPAANHVAELSAGAARQLGQAEVQQAVAVRVRKVSATPPDMTALRAGRPAGDRPDTPPVLLNPLRKLLPAIAVAPSPQPIVAPAPRPEAPKPPVRRTETAAVAAAPAAKGRYSVQIAALSNAGNAQALAKSMGGFVKQGGGLHRVQLGPFATRQEAEQARAKAARAGYRDARVLP